MTRSGKRSWPGPRPRRAVYANSYRYIRGYAPQAHKRRGNQGSPCLLRITTPSFRARCARKSKSLFPFAARLVGQGKQNGCHPRNGAPSRGPGQLLLPLRGNSPSRALRRGVASALLVAFGRWAAETLALRTLRAKRALKGKWVIDKREETDLVSSLLPAVRPRRPRIFSYESAFVNPASAPLPEHIRQK